MLYPKKMKFPDERKAFAFPQEKKVTRKQPNQPTNQIGSVSATDLRPRLSGERNPREGGSPARGKRHEISSGKRGKERKKNSGKPRRRGNLVRTASPARLSVSWSPKPSLPAASSSPSTHMSGAGYGGAARSRPAPERAYKARRILSPSLADGWLRSAKDELAKKREGESSWAGGRAREKGREKGRLAMESWEEKASRNPSVWEQCSAMGVGG